MNNITIMQLINYIYDYCRRENTFIFIAGRGCSGKTTLSLKISSVIKELNMSVNCIHMDDFLTNSEIRKSGVKIWKMEGVNFKGRFTSCCKESYYLGVIESILFGFSKNKDQFIKTKSGIYDLIDSKANFTIFEGLGVPFIPSINGLKIFLDCSEEIEMQRRVQRDCVRLGKTKEEIIASSIDRSSQYKKYIAPFKDRCELVFNSNADFTFSIILDKLGIIP